MWEYFGLASRLAGSLPLRREWPHRKSGLPRRRSSPETPSARPRAAEPVGSVLLLPAQRSRRALSGEPLAPWVALLCGILAALAIVFLATERAHAHSCPRGEEAHCCARLESLRAEYAGRKLTIEERVFKVVATAWHGRNCKRLAPDYSGMRGGMSRW